MMYLDTIHQFARILQQFQQAPPKVRETSEAGVAISPLEIAGFGMENPEALVAEKGLIVFDEMRLDDSLGSYMALKSSAILARDWSIVPASDSDIHELQAEYVRVAIDLMPGSLKEKIRDLLTAREYGFAVANTPIGVIEKGEFKTKLYFTDIKGKEPHEYSFKLDPFRNIEKLLQVDPLTFKIVEHDPKDFIIYTYQKEWGNPYGRSDYIRAYREWNLKKYFIRFWAIHLERFGSGFIDVEHDEGAETSAEHATIKDFVENMMVKAAMIHSEKYRVKLHEAGSAGFDAYENAIKVMNLAMARATLTPELVLNTSGTGGGAFALGKEHTETFFMTSQDVATDLEERVMFDQYIRRQIDFNWPNVEEYPRFRFAALTVAQKLELLASFIAAVEKGVIIPDDEDENKAREILGWPVKEIVEGEEPERGPATPEDEPDDEPEDEPDDDEDADEPEDQASPAERRFFSDWRVISNIQAERVWSYVEKHKIISEGKTKFLAALRLPQKGQMRVALARLWRAVGARSRDRDMLNLTDRYAETILYGAKACLLDNVRHSPEVAKEALEAYFRRIGEDSREIARGAAERGKGVFIMDSIEKSRKELDKIVASLEHHPRVIIAGGPKSGKTTVSIKAGERYGRIVRHGDSLMGKKKWSEASAEVSKWFNRKGSWIVEGVVAPRALRKWIAAHPRKKLDAVIVWMNNPVQVRSDGQERMAKGVATVWNEIAQTLLDLRVTILDKTPSTESRSEKRRTRSAR